MNNAKQIEPPRDRGIWIIANVIENDELSTSVEGYEGYAEWKESSKIWVDRRGMTLIPCLGDELVIFEWCELSERAHAAPDEEIIVDANIYHYGEETLPGAAGFYVIYYLRHGPTGVHLVEKRIGPLASKGLASKALAELLTEPTADFTRIAAGAGSIDRGRAIIDEAKLDYPDAAKVRVHFERLAEVWPNHYRQNDAGFRDFVADIRACLKQEGALAQVA